MDQTEKIQEAFTDISNLKLQIGRLLSNIESEKGTLTREADRLHQKINKVESEFREIIYDIDAGLLIKIDRLTVESMERKNLKNHIIVIYITLGSLILKTVLAWIIK